MCVSADLAVERDEAMHGVDDRGSLEHSAERVEDVKLGEAKGEAAGHKGQEGAMVHVTSQHSAKVASGLEHPCPSENVAHATIVVVGVGCSSGLSIA